MNITKSLQLEDTPEVDSSGKIETPPLAKPLGKLVRFPAGGDPNELLERRFLCRGGGMLLPGPTGIGKSTLGLQMSIEWSLGNPVFDIRPATPLKSLWIQAENDEGDLAEMRDGIVKGLNLTEEQTERAYERVIIAHEDTRSGPMFFTAAVRPLLKEHRPDLLWIDPALAYLGGDNLSQKDVGSFLRNNLNPLLRESKCAAVVLHHTNKPPSGKEKSTWQAGDFAYAGSGSAEWANWARAVLALRSTGSHSVFELVAAKRGSRLDWTTPDGMERVFSKFIAHAKEQGLICWRPADADEIPQKNVPKAEKEDPQEVVLSLVPDSGSISKNALLARANQLGVGKNKARDIVTMLVADGTLFEWRIPRPGNKPEVHLSQFLQPANPKT
jgi:hypothetical protein